MKTGSKIRIISAAAIIGLASWWLLPACADDGVKATTSRQKTQITATADKQAKVKEILSGYNAATLTADDAKAIHEAFRKAGLKAGPQIADAIRAAGFDPDRLKELAPPPDKKNGGENRPPRREDEQGQKGGEGEVEKESL